MVSWDKSKFCEVITSLPNVERMHYSLIEKPIGLERLIINAHQINISANSRVLNHNYSEGICLNTIDQFRCELGKFGIELHQDFMNYSNLSLAHCKNDIRINVMDVIGDFSTINPPKFYKIIRDNSLTFGSNNKGDKMTIIFYGKHKEITSSNKIKYKGLSIDMSNFEGVTRVESRFNDSRTVKKYLGTRNFMEILELTNVNYGILNNILKGQLLIIPKCDLSVFKTLSGLKDYALVSLLNERCASDLNLIQSEIQKRLSNKTKPSYQMSKVKRLLPMVQMPGGYKLENLISLKAKLKGI